MNIKSGNRSQYWFVIRELTGREIKRRYSRSKLGIIWSVLNPLLTMAVLSAVFTQLFARSIDNFPIYYLCGYLIWVLFTGATNSAMTALVDNRMMLIKVKFPMQIFMLARVYTAFVNFLYSLIAFGAILIVFAGTEKYRIIPGVTWFFMPVIVLFVILFSLGIGYILATAYVFFGDVKHLYGVLTTLWMYLSAIFYPVDRLGPLMTRVIHCNPIFGYIDSLRCLVLFNQLPPVQQIVQMVACGIVSYVIGRQIFLSNKNKIMQKL